MTTLDPGARDVFTHGLVARPRSTAFLASNPAPTMTEGFEVLVQEVIEAMTTAPWSISYGVPPDVVTGVGLLARSLPPGVRAGSGGAGRSLPCATAAVAGGSLAGKDSAEPSSAAS